MQLPDPFTYELPDACIAQRPIRPYDLAKMLVVSRSGGAMSEATFRELPRFLTASDLLIFNDTRVIPARFLGMLEGTQTSVEILLLEPRGEDRWEALGKPLKKMKEGTRIVFRDGLIADVVERISSQRVLIHFSAPSGSLRELMLRVGLMPIPPYIRRGLSDDADREDYQTIFAQQEGSVAAPTASLHFTPGLLSAIDGLGCARETLTLHVGAASFVPLWHEHEQALRPPDAERFEVPERTLRAIAATRGRGGRVIAVGTTVVRALESAAAQQRDQAALFITPGHQFKNVDAIITNFHQPRTTHLLLVEAFLGRKRLEESYRYALTHQFRFLSYGDGMLLL